MGIRCYCPQGHKLNVKDFLGGKRAVCPHCGAKFEVPAPSVSAVGVHTADANLPPADLPQEASPLSTPQGLQTPSESTYVPQPVIRSATQWFVRLPHGAEFGPATEALLLQWIAEGRVTADSSLWCTGWEQWLPFSQAQSLLTSRSSEFPGSKIGAASSPAMVAAVPITGPSLDASPVVPAIETRVPVVPQRKKDQRVKSLVGILLVLSLLLLAALIAILMR